MTDTVELCRTIARAARSGSLATMLSETPYASLVALAWDARLRPLFVLSRLAEHTKNLEANARASLLVLGGTAPGDPLATSRMTLVGECAPLAEREAGEARTAFVAAHPEAAEYVMFRDFRAFRLEPARIRLVAGFGRQAWVSGADFLLE